MNSITDRFEIQICASPLDAPQNSHREWRTAFYCETQSKAQAQANIENVRVIDTKEGIILKPSRPVVIPFERGLPEARIG